MSQKNSQGDVGISSSAVLQHCVSALLQDIEMSKTFIYAPSPSLHVSLYSSVFDVLGCCDAAEVFRFFKNTLSDHLKHQVQRLALMYQYNSDLFHYVSSIWRNYLIVAHWMVRIFRSLQSTYITPHDLPSLSWVAIRVFYDEVYVPLRGPYQRALLSALHSSVSPSSSSPTASHSSDSLDSNLSLNTQDDIHAAIQMLCVMGHAHESTLLKADEITEFLPPHCSEARLNYSVYCLDLEQPFLQEVAVRLQILCQHFLQNNMPLKDYLCSAKSAVHREQSRAAKYLHSSTIHKIDELGIEVFLAAHSVRLVSVAWDEITAAYSVTAETYRMLLQESFQAIEVAFSSLKQILHFLPSSTAITSSDVTLLMKKRFIAFCESLYAMMILWVEGGDCATTTPASRCTEDDALISQYSSQYALLLRGIINVHELALQIANRVIGGVYATIGYEVQHRVINAPLLQQGISLASILSEQCDHELTMTTCDVHQLKEMILCLLPQLSDRQSFLSTYQDHLAYRLLTGSSADLDNERLIVNSIKEVSGGRDTFTHHFEGMLSDIRQSQIIIHNMSVVEEPSRTSDIEMVVHVLTDGYWPKHQWEDRTSHQITLPQPMQQFVTNFTWHYSQNLYSSRKLQWKHVMSNVTLVAHYPHGSYSLNISLPQALVLLCFNEVRCEVSLSVLQHVTGILSSAYLQHLLHSLTCGRHKLLKKVSGVSYTVNAAFCSTNKLIFVPLLEYSQQQEEDTDTGGHHFSIGEISGIIDATITRIMKRKRSLSHSALMQEASTLLVRFAKIPLWKTIKSRIESLIERDFLRRDDSNNYHYIP